MRTIILLSALGFVLLVSFTASEMGYDDSKILWSDSTKLSWNDFQGKAPVNASLGAMTYTQLSLDPLEYKFPECKICVKAMFIKTKSWYQEKFSTESLLKHEQLHFDIAELYARKLRKGIDESDFDSKKLQTELSNIFHDYNTKLTDYEAKYDKETNHCRITDDQLKWETAIPKELEKLKDYKDTLVIITIK